METDNILGMKPEALHVYESGAKRSDRTGKGRFDLISPHGLRRLALRYEAGAIDKGDNNWKKGFPISRCVDSAMRHLCQYMAGDRSEDHPAAVMWQMAAICEFEERIRDGRLPKELNDIGVADEKKA